MVLGQAGQAPVGREPGWVGTLPHDSLGVIQLFRRRLDLVDQGGNLRVTPELLDNPLA